MEWDANVVTKNVDAMLAGPVVGAVTENAMAIHPDGVGADNTAPLAAVHFERAVRPIVVLADWVGNADTNGSVVRVPAAIREIETPV